MKEQVHTVRMEDGIWVTYREVAPEGADRYPCFLFIHGSTCHGRAYGKFGPDLAKEGIGVYLMDLRGHGLSEGRRGDAPAPDSLVKDVGQVLQDIRGPQCAGLFLGGHSSGGGIAAKYYTEQGKDIDGLVLLAPYFHRDAPMNRREDTDAVKVSKLKFLLAMIRPSTRFLHYNIADEDDDLSVADYSLNWTRASQWRDYEAGIRSLDLPVVWIVGGEDAFFDLDVMRAEFDKMPSRDKEFILRDGVEHEDISEKSVSEIAGWIRKHNG